MDDAVPPQSSDAANPQLAFEREKWKAESAFRRQDIELKIREENRLQAEQQFKLQEARRNRWSSPLVIAVTGAALAGIGNAAVSWFNDTHQRRVQEENYKQQLDLETFKAESSRILEAIRTGDPDKAATNLRFLVTTGLVTNKSLAEYLKNLKPGEGPSLPSPSPTAQRTLDGDISPNQLQQLLQGGATLGVDVSQHQGAVDFTSLHEHGVRFAYIKASESGTSRNPLLQQQVNDAHKAQLKVGLYHIFDARIGVDPQFAVFADILSTHHWDLPPAVDIVDTPHRNTNDPASEMIAALCKLIEDRFKVRPVLYSTETAPRPSGYELWVPRYNQGTRPPPDFLIWQFSSRGVSGDAVLSGIDLNLFRGGVDELAAVGKPRE